MEKVKGYFAANAAVLRTLRANITGEKLVGTSTADKKGALRRGRGPVENIVFGPVLEQFIGADRNARAASDESRIVVNGPDDAQYLDFLSRQLGLAVASPGERKEQLAYWSHGSTDSTGPTTK